MSQEKLAGFLREVSNWSWEEFCRAEFSPRYTSNEAIIFGLIRSCYNQKLDAIKASLNRLDGKLKTPVKVEYPKFYYTYPNATETGNGPPPTDPEAPAPIYLADGDDPDPPIVTGEVLDPVEPEAPPEADLATMSLRETLAKMADLPRELPANILKFAGETQYWVENTGPQPDEIPRVKSVVAASLLTMAQGRNMNAITEVFDQIDGKLVEVIQVLGEDIHIAKFDRVAPPGAIKNENGVYQIEAKDVENLWARKLGRAD